MTTPPKIEGFVDLELIGRGGQSEVYGATEVRFDRRVALKVMSIDTAAAERRFDAEQRAMGRLTDHPGVLTVYSTTITENGRAVLVMPLLSGGSLADLLAEPGLDPSTAVPLLIEVSRTVGLAHEMDVIHRDLKPANILLDSEGEPRVADFGIAKLVTDETASQSASLTFTPVYSPPESFSSSRPSKATDVYGLAATLWALLAGRPPFKEPGEGVDLLVLINRVATKTLPAPADGLSPALSAVLQKGLAKAPGDRFEDASRFADALEQALESPEVLPLGVEPRFGASPTIEVGDEMEEPLDVPAPEPPSATLPPESSPPSPIVGDTAPDPEAAGSGFVTRHRIRLASVALVLAALVGGVAAIQLVMTGGSDESATEDSTQDQASDDGDPGVSVSTAATEVSAVVAEDDSGRSEEGDQGFVVAESTLEADDSAPADANPPLGPTVTTAPPSSANPPTTNRPTAPTTEATTTTTRPSTTTTEATTTTTRLTTTTTEATTTTTTEPTTTTSTTVVSDPAPQISGLAASASSSSEGLVSFQTNTCTGAVYSYSGGGTSGSHRAGLPNNSQCWLNHSAKIGNPNWRMTPLAPGTRYTVTITVTDASGRTATASTSFTTSSA